jgi:hypothetical protein
VTIHIYYRHCPIGKLTPQARPAWFGYDHCFANLIQTTEAGRADGSIILHVVFDGSPAALEADTIGPRLFRLLGASPRGAVSIHIHYIDGGNQRAAWRACLGIIDEGLDIADYDLIYLLENDYLHVPDWVARVHELSASPIPWDYATLYDHPDKYPGYTDVADSRRYRHLTSRMFCAGSQHWRTTPSSTATYILRGRTFRRDRAILRLGIYDYRLFKLLGLFRRRTVVSPVPSLATHSMSAYLAPVVGWHAVATRVR